MVVKVVALAPVPTVYVRVLLETVTSPTDVLTTAETIVVLITEAVMEDASAAPPTAPTDDVAVDAVEVETADVKVTYSVYNSQ